MPTRTIVQDSSVNPHLTKSELYGRFTEVSIASVRLQEDGGSSKCGSTRQNELQPARLPLLSPLVPVRAYEVHGDLNSWQASETSTS